jgi:hypothetical protein
VTHVAQWIEQLPSKQSVAGSIPAVGTNTGHMDKEIIKRLYWIDGGDGVEYEFWEDSLTNQIYRVPIEIVREFDEAEAVDPVSKFSDNT